MRGSEFSASEQEERESEREEGEKEDDENEPEDFRSDGETWVTKSVDRESVLDICERIKGREKRSAMKRDEELKRERKNERVESRE